MRKCSVLLILVAVAASLWSCGGSPPLPESFGIYARNGNKLIELDSRDFNELASKQPEVIVYQKVLTSDLFSPEEHIKLFALISVRGVFETRMESEDPSHPATQIFRRDSRAELGDPVPLRYSPVPQSPEMLISTPELPLENGSYLLTVAGMNSSERYSLGIKGIETGCFDEHIYTGPKEIRTGRRFSWDQWAKTTFDLMNGKQSERKFADGRPVIKASFEPCCVVDGLVDSWRKDLNRTVQIIKEVPSQASLGELKAAADRLLAVDHEGAEKTQLSVYEALVAGARLALERKQWELATNLVGSAARYRSDPRTEEVLDEIERRGRSHAGGS